MSYYELKCIKCNFIFNHSDKNRLACNSCLKQVIRETHTLDKQRVKEAIEKRIRGNSLVRHELCDKPYGDDCGYCEFCRQTQAMLLKVLFEELGLDENASEQERSEEEE